MIVVYVVGDVGGTNCRLELRRIVFDSMQVDECTIAEHTYASQQYESLTHIVRIFVEKHWNESEKLPWPQALCVAVAGPVRDNRSMMTNVKWVVDGDQMAHDLNIPDVAIINDFGAVAYGLLALDQKKDLLQLNPKASVTQGAPKAVLGAGTGLGQAYLTFNGSQYDVWASEGGHCTFGPRDDFEIDLLQFVQKSKNIKHVSVERVVSGQGISSIFDLLASKQPQQVHPMVYRAMQIEDKGAVISRFAKSGQCPVCVKTMDAFIQLYGCEAGNQAVKFLPFGGLYIAGGVAPKNIWAMTKNNQFYENVVAKGRMRNLLESIPVFVILNKNPGMLGAQLVCKRLLKKRGLLNGAPDGAFNEFMHTATDPLVMQHMYDDADKKPLAHNIGSKL